jgi:hypothetical protein
MLSFRGFKDDAVNFRSLFYGGIASLVLYSSFLFLVGHGGSHTLVAISDIQRLSRYSENSKLIGPPSPEIILSRWPANSAAGSKVWLTARVLAVGTRPTPKGHVRFFDGSTVLYTGKLDNGAVTVEGKLPRTAMHSIHAIYYGDINYSSSSLVRSGKR